MNTVWRRIIIAASIACSLAFGLLGALHVSPATRAFSNESCQLTWQSVSAPHIGTNDSLQDVTALAANDVWAVGSYDQMTLIEHWNGTAWSVVPSPNAPNGSGSLSSVHGTSANDVWAVGGYAADSANLHALILHWDGTAWNIVPTPDLTASHWLVDVFARTTDDVWAVGGKIELGTTLNFALHWNGTVWQEIATPNANILRSTLMSVAAVGANDAWAVGTSILHWDGTQWTVVYYPGETFRGLAALSNNDVWISGGDFRHWDGTQWQIVSPGSSLYGGYFNALDGAATDDIYAVGDTNAHGVLGLSQHFDGAQWNEIITPATARNTTLTGISVVSASEAWAVGTFNSYLPPAATRGVILHATSPCIVPTPIPPPPPLKAPVLVAPTNHAALTQSRVQLDWRNVKNATEYRVQLLQVNSTWKITKTVNRSEFKTPKLANDKTYRWRVRACNPSECSKWSAYFDFKVRAP